MKYLFPVLLFLYSCATVVRPTGGDKDILPPVVLKSTPPDRANNFTGKEVRLTFDEYIEIKDVNGIIISPPQKTKPKIVILNKSLRIQFLDPLANNTTYTVQLIGAINDLNEKNVLDYATLTFSTGANIDTGVVSGFVLDNMTGKSQKAFSVALFNENILDFPDTLIFPLFITKTKEDGSFNLTGIPENTAFTLYAFNDINNNKLIDKGEELGFYNKSVSPYDSISIRTTLYQNAPPITFSTPFAIDNRTFLISVKKKYYQNLVVKSSQQPFDKTQTLYNRYKHIDTLQIVDFIKNPLDSIVSYYLYADTIPIDTIHVKFPYKAVTNWLTLASKNSYAPGNFIEFNSQQPIRNILKNNVLILDKDSVSVKTFSIKNDLFSIQLEFEKQEKENYIIHFKDSAIHYLDNIYSSHDSFLINIQEKRRFGDVSFRINNPNHHQYRIQILTELDQLPIAEQETSSDSIHFSVIPVGEYHVRLEKVDIGKRGDLIIPFKQSPSYIYIHPSKLKVRGGWLIGDFILNNKEE